MDDYQEMLDFVEQHYAHALGDEHARYLREFRELSYDAQCLYVRLVNRKGRVFARRRLRYPELASVPQSLAELQRAGWVGPPGDRHFADVLRFLSKAEIYTVVLPAFAGLGRSLKKADLVEFTLQNMSSSSFLSSLDASQVVVRARTDETRFLLYLYFGRIREELSQFTMRDLGLVRTQSLQDEYEPRFGDRDEALEQFDFADRNDRYRRGHDVAELIAEALRWPAVNFAGSATLRDKLALRLGRHAEKEGDLANAASLYGLGESAACGERLVRAWLTNDEREKARHWLEERIENPRSDEEYHVAQDLYERKFRRKRTSAATDLLRSAETVDIDESRMGAPERAVIGYFDALGLQAFRTENLLWRSFFGLLFWDELFVDGDLNSPFEFLPASLENGSFATDCSEAIDAKLALLADKPALKRELLRISTRYYGTNNGVFRWRRSMSDALFALVDHARAENLRAVLSGMCSDYANSRYGYPDLMVIDDVGVRFVEVKTEGDALRRNQLVRLNQLRDAGFRADVLRVRWVLDPEQEYVVVDVETTGGKGENHRVTEVGAVKLQGGKVIDRFQTLINPQRSIPPGITRLTGIRPEMVADAPYFADIADEFAAFMGDAIFVAHNVEFDYGFISREFARLGRTFRHAKLCTCASMRKLYPGHRSYSLGNLCRDFDIPLKQHHRALCDAEAAAELLLLINEKRETPA